jgi:hypothetical protein
MYFDKQRANVFHPLPSLSRNTDKASLHMARPSTHLALLQAVCCHAKTGPELFPAEHNWCHRNNFHSCMTYPWSASVITLALGLWPRQRVAMLRAKRGSLGVKESVKEWTLTLPRELPPWELESRWTPKCLENDCKGQNPMDLGVLYTIENLLKRKCLKCVRMTHLDIWNKSYGQRKGRKSNWQFDSWPLKVGNRPDFLACRWCATHRWKAFDEGYNFASNLISIQGLHAKLWGPKVARIPTLAISGLPFGSPRTKCHLDVGLVKRCKIYYKGEGGGFPQVRAVVSLVSPSYPWFILAPKVLQLCTNQLVFSLCTPMWIVDTCHSS